MGPGVRAELRVDTPTQCALANLDRRVTIRSVTQATQANGEGLVTDFVAEKPLEDAQKVFDLGSDAVYRLTHDGGTTCVCRRIEELGYPVREHRVEDGVVTLAFFVPDIDALRSVIETLTADGREVTIRRLSQSDADADADSELIFVDRSELTDRQREVLETADRLGYFEHPREANAGDVADELGITRSTFTEHLAAAQRKLLGAVVG